MFVSQIIPPHLLYCFRFRKGLNFRSVSRKILDVFLQILEGNQCSAEAAFLRHCPTNFENDAAKTVPAGHLAHTEFWPGAGL